MPLSGFFAPFGNMFQRDNATVTTINTVDVFEQVVNFTEGETEGIDFASSTLTTGDCEAFYSVSYAACIIDSTGKVYEMAIEIDGAIQDASLSCTTIPTGSGLDNLVGTFIGEIPAGTDVKLMIRNITNNTNVLIVHASVVLIRIK